MGAFEQLFRPGRGEFEQKFSKNSNAQGLPGGGGMLKLQFDWYIILKRVDGTFQTLSFEMSLNKVKTLHGKSQS